MRLHYVILLALAMQTVNIYAQNGNANKKQLVKFHCSGSVDATLFKSILNNGQKITELADLENSLQSVLNDSTKLSNKSGDVRNIYTDIKNENLSTSNTTTAVILIYRDMQVDNAGNLKITPNTNNYLIYNKERDAGTSNHWSEYLLNVRHILFVLVDADQNWYQAHNNGLAQADILDPLTNESTNFAYNKVKSFFQQSLSDELTLINTLGITKSSNALEARQYTFQKLQLTFIELDPDQLKLPRNIVVSNKLFKQDLTFDLHARNTVTFQNGIALNNLRLNNFSITQGKLVVTPDSAQKKSWKSAFNILLEFHIPRDIDNFKPVWGINLHDNKTFAYYLYEFTLQRIGVYGGLKLSTDPLSNLYFGFNYAVSKEVALNFGWVWNNEIKPQIDSIGNITSISDAESYAKRKYAPGQFSIGISFSPSAVISMLGLKSSSSPTSGKTGNSTTTTSKNTSL